MSELGDVLKRARLERGLSLDAIQEQTKIRKRYLEALEEGNFEVLPGKFYVRAFIKNYAEAIGLDANEVLKYYEDDIPKLHPQSDEVIPARKPQRMRSTSSEKISKIIVNILLWGFFILILVVLWYYFSGSNTNEPEKADEQKITQSSEAPQLNTDIKVDTSTPTPTPTPVVEVKPTFVTYVEKVNRDDIYEVVPSGETFTLSVMADGGESWIEIYENSKSGNKLHYTTMQNGDVKTVLIPENAYLVVGRPGYIKMTVDEAVVDIGDSIRESKRILLKKAAQ